MDFILQNAVFTFDELRAAHRKMANPPHPPWVVAHAKPFIDPWLIAPKLADSVAISHDGRDTIIPRWNLIVPEPLSIG